MPLLLMECHAQKGQNLMKRIVVCYAIRDAEYARRKTENVRLKIVTTVDVVYALQRQGKSFDGQTTF